MPQQQRLKIPIDMRKIKALPDIRPGQQHQDLTEVQNYLKRFGYMREDAAATPATLDEQTSKALSRMQQRYTVGQPGVFDKPTRDLMSTARCGLADLSSALDFATICAWNRRNLTFAFGPLSGQGTANNATCRNAILAAFNTWAAAGVGLSFTEVATSANPDIRIEWRQANDPDHSMVGGVLAHADFPPGCSVVVNNLPLPLHYDDQEHTWVNGAVVNGFDIQTVALHEIGHLLGLGHTNVNGSVMFPFVSSNFTLRNLQQDDINGIRALYPALKPTIKEQASIINSDGRLEVFSIANTDGALWNIWQTVPHAGPWSNFNRLGGIVKRISAARNSDGRLEVFGIGSDNALWNIWQQNPHAGPWSNWNRLGGGVKQIASACNSDGRLEVFGIGMDNALWNIWQTVPHAGPWSGWNSLGGGVKQIAAALNTDGRLEVFAIGMDNALWNIWQRNPHAGPWSNWNRLGGIVKQISAAVNSDGRLEVFGIGSDDALWNIWQQNPHAGPWSNWNRLGGVVKQITSALNSDGRLEVFGIGTDNALWNIWQQNPHAGPWSNWNRLGGIVKQISAAVNSDGRLEVFGIGSDDRLWNIWQQNPHAGPWSGWNQL